MAYGRETNGMVESQNRHFSRNSLICPTFKIASVKKILWCALQEE
jgi:hypothetical protein